jgi:D-beta-D-heptose 7-phosphate kinase/D-beta-D-heptose 1-phosphate adenosyltransferase
MPRIEIEKAVESLRGVSVLVVGDLMLDEYLWGRAERVSPEAPVPVVTVARQELRLGGAGNVINNLAALGCQVGVVGVLGDDPDGEDVKRLLALKGIDLSGIFSVKGRMTSRKTRVVATSQQMIRVDRESREAIDDAVAARVTARCAELLGHGVQAVILSDYGKGSLTERLLRELIDLSRQAGVPVLADPKGHDFRKYAGATILTPNRKEASLASGRALETEADIVALGIEMRHALALDALLITRSERGMSLFLEDGPRHLPAKAREVFDVSGAGDTVIAVLGAALGAGLDFVAAAELANLAAGVVVGKVGTSTVSHDEMLSAAGELSTEMDRKIKSRDALRGIVSLQRERGKTIVFTNGCFDLLHVGHVKYLQAARQLGDLLVLGLNSDASIRRLKGAGRPLINQEERSHILAALSCIDFVSVFDEDTPLQLIEALRPDILVKGGDYTPETVVGSDLVESYGGRVELIRFVDGKSTTGIIEKILTQYGEA